MTLTRRRGRRNRPVFIERSGRRRRLLRSLAAVLGCACAGYLLILVVIIDALRQPTGTAPPRMDEPLPTTNARHDSTVRDSTRPDGDGAGAGESGGESGERPAPAEPTRTPTATPTPIPGGTTGPAVPRALR